MAFDYSSSFAGINSGLANLGKRLDERAATGALLQAFDQSQAPLGQSASLVAPQAGQPAAGRPSLATLGSPNEIETRFVNTVKGAGLTNPVGLGAVAAYGKAESGFAPQNVNRSWSDPSESGQPGTAGGIMSWRADRLQNLQNFAKQRGEQQPSVETQALFLAQENPQLIPALQAAKTPQEANQIMANAWRFAGYNRPGGENARRLALTEGYAQRFGGQGGPAPAVPVQVAENEADVQRLEAQQGNPVIGGASAPVQVAQAQPQPGAAVADAPAQGAAEAQGFAIPGGQAAPATRQNTNVQMIRSLIANPGTRAAGLQLWQQLATGKQFGFQVVGDQLYRTDPRSGTVEPVGVSKPVAPVAVSEGQTLVDPRTGQVVFQGQPKERAPVSVPEGGTLVNPQTGQPVYQAPVGNKARQDIATREGIADQQGYQGEDRKFYIANGRLPSANEKVTEGQANAALYADRMKEAEAVLAQAPISEASASRMQRGLSGVPIYGNNLVSPEYQQADQAKRNFINAALRRESGAVISPAEFENAEKQYFPQPGDSKQVLEQKVRNRQTAIQGISNAAGPSYAKRQKEAAPQQFREGQRASNGQQTIVFRNGQWVPE